MLLAIPFSIVEEIVREEIKMVHSTLGTGITKTFDNKLLSRNYLLLLS